MSAVALPSTIDIADAADLVSLAGRELVVTDWIDVPQEMIDAFACATGDQQWIHVDRERAAASPFRTTIAHGFLTLALLPRFLASVRLAGSGPRINAEVRYARFLAPLPSGSRVRARIRLAEAVIEAKAVRATWDVSIERERSPVPVCVTAWVVLYLRS